MAQLYLALTERERENGSTDAGIFKQKMLRRILAERLKVAEETQKKCCEHCLLLNEF
jgi:hypothetical protein